MRKQLSNVSRRFPILLAFVWGASLGLSSAAAAQNSPLDPIASDTRSTPVALPITQTRVLTLKDLGQRKPVRLRGVQGEITIPVNVRDDEVVTRARLTLDFAHSPSLLWDVSHLNLMINNELAATIPLTADTADGLTRVVDIDPRLFVQYNQIGVQLIAHYRYECEDPAYTSLWGILSNLTSLELETTPLSLANDLNLLPLPFFDSRDSRKMVLPFVFSTQPSLEELEAAGVVASWFGAMASYRGAEFPVHIGDIPADSHAVVFAANGTLPAGVVLQKRDASGLAVVNNPKNQYKKILVVHGTDGAGLNMAARALALGSEALAGASTVIREFEEPAKRKPYDAPRWLPTHRKVQIGEIAEDWQLQVSGLYPDVIRTRFSLPPDLFTWRKEGMRLDLKYRYTPTVGSKSTLNVSANDGFVEAIALSYTGEDKAAEDRINLPFAAQYEAVNSATIYIPDYRLSSENELQFQYYFERKKEGACKDIILDNLRGVVDESSTIDLTDFPHYTQLPNLAMFANGGFPYTKLADLSETGIVLPNTFGEDEVSTYLAIMGLFGDVTGYPANRFKLTQASGIDTLVDRDILVIGAAGDQPVLERWADYMPMTVARGETRLKVIGPIERLKARWEGKDLDNAVKHAGKVILEAGRSLGAVMSFESPLSSKRTVVVLTAGDSARLRDVSELFIKAGKNQFVRGDLVLLNGDEVNHYSLGHQYAVGKLPLFTALRFWLSRQPLFLIVIVGIIAFVLGLVLFRLLRNLARYRLKTD